jgi:hypothetical protein
MADALNFAFGITGTNKKTPGMFTEMFEPYVLERSAMLERDRHKPTSLITAPTRVRFVHFNFQENDIFVRDEFFGNVSASAEEKKRARQKRRLSAAGDRFRCGEARALVQGATGARRHRPWLLIVFSFTQVHRVGEGATVLGGVRSSDRYRASRR